jgi:hypothetical protein
MEIIFDKNPESFTWLVEMYYIYIYLGGITDSESIIAINSLIVKPLIILYVLLLLYIR